MKGSRLRIFNDPILKDSFIFASETEIFARSDRINGKWVVWFIQPHFQASFSGLKEAISAVNRKFARSVSDNEIYKGTSRKGL